jgi:hypothetical protein
VVLRGYEALIVVIVEGPSDKGFIEGLCGRLGVKCLVLIMRGNRFDKARRLLRIYEGHPRILVKDLKGSPRALDKIAGELGEAGARVVVAVKELEAWILAGLCYSNAEEIPDPSWELRRAKGVLKSEHTYREIAASLDLERAKANSPSFRELLEQLSPKHS